MTPLQRQINEINESYRQGKYDAVVTIVGKLTRENHWDAAEYTLTAAQESGLLKNRECNEIATVFGLELQWEE